MPPQCLSWRHCRGITEETFPSVSRTDPRPIVVVFFSVAQHYSSRDMTIMVATGTLII